MMEPIAKQTFEAAVGLSEAEIRAISTLCAFDLKPLVEHLRKQYTSDLNASVLLGMFARWRDETSACIRRFDAARDAFDGKERGP